MIWSVPLPQCYTQEDMRRWKMLVVGHRTFVSSLFSSLFSSSSFLVTFLLFYIPLFLIFLPVTAAAVQTWFWGAKIDRNTQVLTLNVTSNTGQCCEVMSVVSLPAAGCFPPFIPPLLVSLLLFFSHLEELMLTLQMGFVSSVSFFFFFFSSVQVFVLALFLLLPVFPSRLICSFIHVDVHL